MREAGREEEGREDKKRKRKREGGKRVECRVAGGWEEAEEKGGGGGGGGVPLFETDSSQSWARGRASSQLWEFLLVFYFSSSPFL